MASSKLSRILMAGTLSVTLVAGLAPGAFAATPVSELKDVPPNSWAYNAIQQLVEKYEVMEGYPDNTFRGNKTLTRYELAAALARVMAKVEEMIASATGQPVSVEPNVNPQDLRTIARLQREFRDELEVLKGRVDGLDTRVTTLEKRLRWSGEMRAESRDFLGANPVAWAPFADYRVRNRLNLDASLSDTLAYHGSLYWDVYGTPQQGDAFAVNLSPNPYTELYVGRSYGIYTPGPVTVTGGLVNASEVMTLGSTLKNPFTTNLWREGTGGYGFVGTPGLNLGAATAQGATAGSYTAPVFATVASPTERANGAPAAYQAPVWYMPGTDVVLQALDPNATQAIAPDANLTATVSGSAGPFSLGLAMYQPSIAGRDETRLAALGYPSSLPQPELYNQGARMLATVGGDFGLVRAQLAAKTVGSFIDTSQFGTFNKTIAGTIDVGSDALGLSLQAVSRTGFAGNFNLNNASATLASNDLLGTGFGLGLGLNAGSVIGTNVGQAQAFTAGSGSLLGGLGGMDYASYGLYVKVPGFSVVPNIVLALQQTAGPSFSTTIASGLTVQADLALWELPKIQLEYSAGKFNPGMDNGLLNSGTFISNEALEGQVVIPF